MIAIENRQKRYPIDRRRLRGTLRRLLKAVGNPDGEISIVLTDDAQIQEINRHYLNRDRPTNVISFAMMEGEFGAINPNLLGDIVISLETASRDAEKGRLDFEEEVAFLLIHGLLHLLGYDHEEVEPSRALAMKAKERELFDLLGYGELDPGPGADGPI
ncbi:MAG: rRNA maturation RNase YbeY [Syntrophaceae bacterium]|nr:rRNA maturation RNase YbeY [Syntrophaceae bacterium]